MVSRVFWAIGIGIPTLLMLYLGLVGLNVLDDDEWFQLGYIPSYEFSLAFIGVSLLGFFGGYYHMTMRAMQMGKHCELTSAGESIAIVGFLFVVIARLAGYNFPIASYTDWFYFFLIIALAGGIGIILYRLEKHKPIIPGL